MNVLCSGSTFQSKFAGAEKEPRLGIMSELILKHQTPLPLSQKLSLFSTSTTDNGPKRTEQFVEDIQTVVEELENQQAELQNPTDGLDFTKYEDRIKSFANWPNKEVPKELLATAGFFYKNQDDIVECPFCHIEGYKWVAGDKPMSDHRSWSPNCPFVMTSVEHDNSPSEASRNVDTCGRYGLEILPNSVPEDERKQLDLERLGVQKNKGPVHPEKFSLDSRLKTFAAWPKSMKQTPQELAEAGFFYLGVGDQTLCFHCGGGLKDWEEDDDPWEEHALWFSKCSYLQLKKGQEYIDHVKQKKCPSRPSVASTSTNSQQEAKEKPLFSVVNNKSDRDPEDKNIDKTLCKICFSNESGVVFLPCGHVVACVDCAVALKNCVVCRKPLEATVRVFIS